MRLADGVDYTFWTFGGTVPGKFIRVREGDLVELHLKNHTHSTVPHNIDLHAVTGPGGGAAASLTMPGGESVFTFTRAQPRPLRLPLRHVAGADAHRQRHVRPDPRRAEGGPAEGRPRVLRDAERVLHEAASSASTDCRRSTWRRASRSSPTYVVFNGAVGALTGDKALQAKVGERVRLFVGNGGPNLIELLPRDRRGVRQRLHRGRHRRLAAQRADDAGSRRRLGDRGVRRSRSRAT